MSGRQERQEVKSHHQPSQPKGRKEEEHKTIWGDGGGDGKSSQIAMIDSSPENPQCCISMVARFGDFHSSFCKTEKEKDRDRAK